MSASNNYTPQVPGPVSRGYTPQQPGDSVLDSFLNGPRLPVDPFEDLRQGYEAPKPKKNGVRRKIGVVALGAAVTLASIGVAIGFGNHEEEPAVSIDEPIENISPVSSLQPDHVTSTTTQSPGEPIILQPTEIGNVEFSDNGPILQDINWSAWVQGDKYMTEMLSNNEMSAEMASSNIRIIMKNGHDFVVGTAGLLELADGDVGLLTVQHVTDNTEGDYAGGMFALIPGKGTVNISEQIGHIDRSDLTERVGSASEQEDGDAAVVVHLSAEQQEIIRSFVEKGELTTFRISDSPSQIGDSLHVNNGRTGYIVSLIQVRYNEGRYYEEYYRQSQPDLVIDSSVTGEALDDGEFDVRDRANFEAWVLNQKQEDLEKLQESADAFLCEGQSGSPILNEEGEAIGVTSAGVKQNGLSIGPFSFELIDGATCFVEIIGSNA